MAGFTIPNAPDSDKSTLDQSEPDRVDFEILGNRRKGVVSGAAVTVVSGNTVNVASGTIAYEGTDYSLSGNASYSLSSAPSSGNRFDLVVARYATNAVSIQTITGTASSTNPVFPALPDTDVVLAAVLRRANESVISNDIIDKRAFVLASTPSEISISTLNIDGGTDIGADLTDADLIIVDDGATGTNRKSVLSRLATYIFGKVSGDATATSTGTFSLASRTVGSSEYDNLTLNAQTGTSYTLALSDAHKVVTLNNANAVTLTVPPSTSAAFEVGDQVNILQLGAGQVTVVGGAGVTLRAQGSKLKLNGQYAIGTLVKLDTDEWVLVGNTTS